MGLKEYIKSLGPGHIINGTGQSIDIISGHEIGALRSMHATNGIDADGIILGSISGPSVTVRKGGATTDRKTRSVLRQPDVCLKISDFSTAIIFETGSGSIQIYNDMHKLYTEDWSLRPITDLARNYPRASRKTLDTRPLTGHERHLVRMEKNWVN